MANEEKIYVGSGKKSSQFDQVTIDVCLTKIPKEFITEDKNGNKYIKLKVSAKREIDQYGKSHAVTVDTWKPEPRSQNQNQPVNTHGDDRDLPF